jgi:6-phosphogluconolactonase
MSSRTTWSRRTFLSNAGLAAAAATSSRSIIAKQTEASTTAKAKPFLACIASSLSGNPSLQQIETYKVQGGSWRPLNQAFSCEPVGAFAIHPEGKIIYVAHDTSEYLGLPRASVSALAIDGVSRSLLPLSRKALTLSATHPKHITVSPDGRTLLVSASGGGSYNVFPLASDGSILHEQHALKLTGCGPYALQSSAQPRATTFSSNNTAYACDFGSDRIDHLSFTNSVPRIASRIALPPGSAPKHLAIHPSAKVLTVVHHLQPALSLITIDPDSEQLGTTRQQVPLNVVSAGPIAFTPLGETLYVAGTAKSGETILLTFQVDHASFKLQQTALQSVAGIHEPDQLFIHEQKLFLTGKNGIASLQLGQFNSSSKTNFHAEFQPVLHKKNLTSVAIQTL